MPTKKKPLKKKTYFSTFFSIGVILFLFGALEWNVLMFVAGLALAIIGAANRDKWAAEGCHIDRKTAAIALVVGFLVALAIAIFF